MIRVAMVAPNFLNRPDRKISTKTKTEVKQFTHSQSSGNYIVCKSIEDLLIKINSATSYEEIPSKVMVSYKNLIDRNLNFKDTLDAINLTTKIAANKFNEKPIEVMFTGWLSNKAYKFDIDSCEKLIAAGWLGCTVSPLEFGVDCANEEAYCHEKDPTYWSRIVIPEKKIITSSKLMPLEIPLTFRQEQILKLVCEKGMTNYQIAKRLNLSESTVKMHLGIVFKKYAVQDRSQLIFSLKEKIG